MEGGGDDVEVAVAVEIGGPGLGNAREEGDFDDTEPGYPVIDQRPDAVRRPGQAAVHRVAVGVKDIEVAVAIQIGDVDPARPPGGIGETDQFAVLVAPLATRKPRVYRLVLLGKRRHDVVAAIAIEIGNAHIQHPMPRIDDDLPKSPACPGIPYSTRFRCPEQHPQRSARPPSELRHDQIAAAVVVPIEGDGTDNPPQPAPDVDH